MFFISPLTVPKLMGHIMSYAEKMKRILESADSAGPAFCGIARRRVRRLLRMIRIHDLLSAGRYPNCSLLAREFEVSTKTVQRDVDFMRDQLVLPIEYDRARHGFAYTRAVAQFPLITVSEGELVALLVAQKAVEQYRGTSFEKPLQTAFQKLVSSLGDEASVSLHELSEAVSFHYAGSSPRSDRGLRIAEQAVMSPDQLVEFDYLSLRARKPERRRVAPYHLACINNQWYLIARDQARQDLRTFASDTHWRRNEAEDFLSNGRRIFPFPKCFREALRRFEAGKTEGVRIRFDAVAARLVSERQWHKSQEIRQIAAGRDRVDDASRRRSRFGKLDPRVGRPRGSDRAGRPARSHYRETIRSMAAKYSPLASYVIIGQQISVKTLNLRKNDDRGIRTTNSARLVSWFKFFVCSICFFLMQAWENTTTFAMTETRALDPAAATGAASRQGDSGVRGGDRRDRLTLSCIEAQRIFASAPLLAKSFWLSWTTAALNGLPPRLELQPINIYELVTFYPWFRREAAGKTIIRVCRTLACAMAGSYAVKEEVLCGCRTRPARGTSRLRQRAADHAGRQI